MGKVGEVRSWQVERVLLALIWVLGVLKSVPGYKRTLVYRVGVLDMMVLQKRGQVTIFARETVCMMKVRSCLLLSLPSLLSSGVH